MADPLIAPVLETPPLSPPARRHPRGPFALVAPADGVLGGVPVAVGPVAGEPSDASALALAWTTPDARARHRVQVARDAAFTAVVADVESPGDALVLHGALPGDEATYYWRVGDGFGWSAPAAFRASTDDGVIAHRDALAADARVRAKALAAVLVGRAGVAAETDASWRTAGTSRAEALVLIYAVVVSFVLTLVFIFRASP